MLTLSSASVMTNFGLAAPNGAERPIRYLHLIAEVAARLLAASDPATMVEEAFALIQDELKLDMFFNYRYDELDHALHLETCGGLTEAQTCAIARLEMGEAVCGRVARDRLPIYVSAVQRSDDPMVGFVKEAGLEAYACTPLLQGDHLLGTLSFGRRWSGTFEPDELQFLRTICHYVTLAKQRLRIERELRQGVQLRERLLGELNHRVRNSLQLVTGLIAMEAIDTEDAEARRALTKVSDRILTVAAVHQRLYDQGDPDRIEISKLLESLARDIIDTDLIPLRFDSDGEQWFDIEKAVALSLAFEELLRPLLVDRSGHRPISIRISGENGLRVQLTDPDHRAIVTDRRILPALVRQLRAKIEIDVERGIVALDIPKGMSNHG